MTKTLTYNEVRLPLGSDTTIEDVQEFTAEVVDAYGDEALVGVRQEGGTVFLVGLAGD